MIRELIDTDLEAVAGGLFDLTLWPSPSTLTQTASANANAHQRPRCCSWWRGYRC